MKEVRIIGIQVIDRIKESGRTQKLLSEYGSTIKSRLGFHELNQAVNSRTGFILLELRNNPLKNDELESKLNEIGGIRIQKMNFAL